MVGLHNRYNILDHPFVYKIYDNDNDKVIAYMRGDLLFVFNFHPTRSFTDYGIPVKGKFSIILDSDDPVFGGFDRIARDVFYTSTRKTERPMFDQPFYLYLYLPSRSAIVMKKESVKRATDI